MDETIESQGTETQETQPPANPADEVKNLKAEMHRKLTNLEQSNAQLMQYLQSLNAPAPAPKAEPKKMSDVWYDNPDEAARIIEERTRESIKKELRDQQAATQKQQSTLNQLVSDFPELQDNSHALHKLAVENYNALPDDEKSHPMAYKNAVKDAALELGVKPKRLRPASEEDSFSLAAGAGTTRKPAKELSKATEYLAKQFGLELTPERKERLKTNHGRKSYNSWE